MARHAAYDSHLIDAVAVERGAADAVDVMVRGLDLDLKSTNFTQWISVVRHTDGEPSRWMSDWRRNDRSHVTVYLRALSSGGDAKLAIDPGIPMEDVKGAGDQTIAGVELPANAADPVDLAEITRDLDALM